MDDYQEQAEVVLNLLELTEAPGFVRTGATDVQLERFEQHLGRTVPDELRAWLRVCNGSLSGPGGFFGVDCDLDSLDIATALSTFPHWQERAWLPVASDGCGSVYVLALGCTTSSGHAILFLDHESSQKALCDTPTYVAASGLWPFLRLVSLRESHLIEWHWPFDKERTLQHDPDIIACSGVPLPWML